MVTALAILCGIGLVMASLLAIGRKAFAVEVDERQEKVLNILPGTNCGGCGYAGCAGYALALVKGEALPNACPSVDAESAKELGRILGVEVELKDPIVALIACAGGNRFASDRSQYVGIEDCKSAHGIAGGFKSCSYGCLGLGSCIRVCAYDAIRKTGDGIVYVDTDKCVGCGVCVDECPRGIIRMVPAKQEVHVLCVNPDKAKAVKAVCAVGCTGCKLCTKQSNQFIVEGALARVAPNEEEEIPESAALVCAQGSIFDRRQYALSSWLQNPETRSHFEKRAETWKQTEKEKKARAKAAKVQTPKAAGAATPPSDPGGEQ